MHHHYIRYNNTLLALLSHLQGDHVAGPTASSPTEALNARFCNSSLSHVDLQRYCVTISRMTIRRGRVLCKSTRGKQAESNEASVSSVDDGAPSLVDIRIRYCHSMPRASAFVSSCNMTPPLSAWPCMARDGWMS